MDNTTEDTIASIEDNMDAVTEDKLTTLFDQLVYDGVIVHGPHISIPHHDFGYPFEFRICPHLATKPNTVGAPNPGFNGSRRYGPGSDMFCPDERLNIVQLNHTHQLALNLFCVDRPQLLMLTLDSYKRQHETLDLDDMKVMLEVLRLFPSFYVLFNCGEQGGCSRVHKHMQGLRGPPHAFRHIMYDDAELPYKHFARYFIKGFKNTSAADVFTVYLDEIDACRRAMKLTWRDPCPHNVVMWMDTLIVIPRRKGSYNGVSANTAGMLGSVWVSSMDEMQEWKSIGCSKVLTELGYIS